MKKQNPRDRVPDDEWIGQADAAKRLGVTLGKVALLIAHGHLEPAGNSRDDMGVTLSSLRAEVGWRATASRRARLLRLTKDVLNWV